MTRYRFVERERGRHPVRRLCTPAGASVSGFYAWAGRGPGPRAMADRASMSAKGTCYDCDYLAAA